TGVGLWFGRAPLLIQYYAYRLANASEESWEIWGDRLVATGAAGEECLLRCCDSADSETCRRASVSLGKLSNDDESAARGADNLLAAFTRFGAAGQEAALDWCIGQAQLDRVRTVALVRPLVPVTLKSESVTVRLHGICLAMRVGRPELDCVVPLLRDASAEI